MLEKKFISHIHSISFRIPNEAFGGSINNGKWSGILALFADEVK